MQTGLQRDHPGQQSHAPARDNGPQRHKRDNSGHQRRALILRAAGGVLGKPLQPISAVLRGRTSGSDIPGALHFGRRLICICLVYTHIISIEGPLLILICIVMSQQFKYKDKRKLHEVSQINNLKGYEVGLGLLVAQPRNYVITHLLFWLANTLYATITVPSIFSNSYQTLYPLFYLSLALIVFIQILMVCLGVTDPGMVPKILANYQAKELIDLPINKAFCKG